MGYAHIDNLYRPEAQAILMFKTVYAMEKIHGTSAHIRFQRGKGLTFFSGGTKMETFVNIFKPELVELFEKNEFDDITVFGESYGGKEQGMSYLYGTTPKFVAFDVRITRVDDSGYFLSVPLAEKIVNSLGLEFVFYKEVSTDLAILDAERDADSVQAIRNGIDPNKCRNMLREGIVIRPLVEFMLRGHRVCAKHKSDKFHCGGERKNTPKVDDPAKLKLFTDAQEAAEEFVTEMRLNHVLGKLGNVTIADMPVITKAMVEDVEREASGEILANPETRRAISRKTAELFKKHLNTVLRENQ